MKSFDHIYESSKGTTNKFVRYGRMDKWQKQANHVNKRKDIDVGGDFHTAPVSRGFYAMPHDLEERFLISSLSKTQPDLFKDEYDKEENPFDNNPFYDKEGKYTYPSDEENAAYEKKCNDYLDRKNIAYKNMMSKNRHIFTMKDTDLIWHHLVDSTPNNEIEKRSGSWILTTVKAFNNAKRKSFNKLKGRDEFSPNYKPTGPSALVNTSWDAYEVFIAPERF